MTRMRGNDWREAQKLAAELITEHRMDLNMLQGVVYYIKSHNPTKLEINAWIDAQIAAAQYFPRSNQTVRYTLIMRSLIEYLWDFRETLAEDPPYLAEVLGWIMRRMYYYRNNQSEARDLTPNPSALFIPEPPRYVLKSRAARKNPTATAQASDAKRDEEVSGYAKDLFSRFFGGDDEDDKSD